MLKERLYCKRKWNAIPPWSNENLLYSNSDQLLLQTGYPFHMVSIFKSSPTPLTYISDFFLSHFFPFIYLHHYLRITFKIEYTSRNLSWGNTIYWRIFKERKLKTKKQTPTISKIHCNTATFQPSFFSSKLISLPPPYFTKRSNQRSSTFFHYQIYQPTCICFFLLSSHRLSGPGSQPKLTPFSCTY